MSLTQFILSVLLLLGTPGPTNTLMALGGYHRGWLGAMPLIGAELGGYLTVILPVATLAAPLFDAHPQAALWAKLCAGVWVLYLSYRLWTARNRERGSEDVSFGRVYVTTVLNPKALIIALVIMPHGGPAALAPWLLLFAGLILFAASGWILAGSLMARNGRVEIRPIIVQRVAAACLLVFAAILAGSSIQSLGA